jgi:hypothetical protein
MLIQIWGSEVSRIRDLISEGRRRKMLQLNNRERM